MLARPFFSALAALLALSACSLDREISSPGSLATAAVMPGAGCAGTHRVTVDPCPIRLTRHDKSGVVVTVGGPHVAISYLTRLNSCASGKFCYYIERDGNSNVKWLVTPGKDCGGADIKFIGDNGGGEEIGYAFLRVKNTYCPARR